MHRIAIYLVLVGASLAVAAPAQAGGCACERCDICGCNAQCEKTCKLIVGTKIVPKVTYCAECEDICIPGPSRACGKTCDCDVNPCTGCVEHHSKTNWSPNPCGTIRTKAKLVKIETPKQVPTYKWIVVKVCGNCAKCGHLSQNSPAPESMLAAETGEVQSPAAGTSQVVQASATEAISSQPEKKEELASPALIVKSKLMSLLGK